MLSVRGLVKAYHDRTVLDGVDLDVAEHQVVVLIGASGSGKSTLLRCIDLLEDIDDGQILLDGRDISDPRIDADEARQAMGMVFQSFNLFPHMTALANVTLAPRVVHGATRRDAEDAAANCWPASGWPTRPTPIRQAVRRPAAAGRDRPRAGLRPRLLLLDEITSALDPELVGEVLDLVGELADVGAHHRDGHPRDGVRPRRGRHGVLPRRRPNRRIRFGRAGFDRSAAGPDPQFLRRVTGAGRG